MEESRLTFNKPGRPRENAVQRRLEIFEAVAPLLRARGPKQLSMGDAARAAHVSIGTLYRYFAEKRALVLYGVDPEPAAFLCERFERAHGHLRATDHAEYQAAVVELVVSTLELMRASVDAAITLGPDALRGRLDAVQHQPVAAFTELLGRAQAPGASRSPEDVERSVRRSLIPALLERRLATDELRRQLRELLEA